MAFLPDEMWDSFTFGQTCGSGENDMCIDFNRIVYEKFADLETIPTEMASTDFALTEQLVTEEFEDETVLRLKQDSDDTFIKEELNLDLKCDLIEEFDSSMIDIIADDLDTIKTDCMWSSTLHLNMGRKRDISLTLSEISEGQIVIKDVELLGTTPPALESNTFFGGMMDSSLNAACSDSDTESASTDEEIDVVSSSGSDRSILQNQHGFKSHKKIQHIEPGSSLLLNRHRPSSQQQQSKENKSLSLSHQTFIDHSYFSVPPPSPNRLDMHNIRGMLTPTESSDEESINTRLHDCKIAPSVSNSIDKRKIAQAVQSLIKNNQQSQKHNTQKKGTIPENIKFRFRMKFKPNSQRNTLLAANSRQQVRRKSAIMNPHCPPPVKGSKTRTAAAAVEQTSLIKVNTKSMVQNGKPGSPKSSSKNVQESIPPREQKCREVRDLHNSMERQRRVDLRKNFNQLKSVIPELAETEKVSKLNILNKASDFCYSLAAIDAKLKKEIEKENAKKLLLRKKLQTLSSALSNGSRVASSRVSVLHAKRVN